MKWTNTMLSDLEMCGERFRRRHIDKDRRPSSPRQHRGSAIHRMVRRVMLSKLDTGALPSPEQVKDEAAQVFADSWTTGVLLSKEEQAEGPVIVRDREKDMAINLSLLYRTDVAPAITPLGVERRVEVRPKDSDLVIAGTVDIVEAVNGVVAQEGILDVKSSGKSPSQNAAHASQQLTMYGLIEYVHMGQLPVRYRLDYLVQTPKKKDLKYVPLESRRDLTDLRTLVERINTATAAVERGVFIPAHPDSWWCAPTWCEYWDSCPYAARGASRPQA